MIITVWLFKYALSRTTLIHEGQKACTLSKFYAENTNDFRTCIAQRKLSRLSCFFSAAITSTWISCMNIKQKWTGVAKLSTLFPAPDFPILFPFIVSTFHLPVLFSNTAMLSEFWTPKTHLMENDCYACFREPWAIQWRTNPIWVGC